MDSRRREIDWVQYEKSMRRLSDEHLKELLTVITEFNNLMQEGKERGENMSKLDSQDEIMLDNIRDIAKDTDQNCTQAIEILVAEIERRKTDNQYS